MKILGINGSPRLGGNTDTLLDQSLKAAKDRGWDAEKIILNQMDIIPPQEKEYYEVNEEGLSPIEDDMHIIYQKVKECDAIIVASPVFFGSLSAQTKIMIDRFQCVWVSKYLLDKDIFTKKIAGGFICVSAAHRKDFFQNAKSIVRNLFKVIKAKYTGELFCHGLEEKEDAHKHPDFLDSAYELGKKITSKKP
ncbi:MAG: flavodoxin family protein [Candidatus Aminicenantes bacterium]|nr:flavodoxin family protein [Candidatus Aminicenantes bacterium]